MADAVVSAVVQPMVTLIKDQVSYTLSLVRGVENEIDSLSKELENVRNKQEDAERKQSAEEGVKAWLVRLEDVSYEMEDVLDEWHTARRKFQIQQQSKNKVCSFISCLCFKKVAVRYDIATKIKNVKDKHDDLIRKDEKKHNGFDTSTTIDRPQSISWVDSAEVHGRDNDRDVVVSKIFVTAYPGELETVSIVGVGGVGKTTLAQLIFNDSRVKKCFELLIWICVSDPFDEVLIVKQIVERVRGSSPPISNQLELLRSHLESCILGKKFLLVLDDVWTNIWTEEHLDGKWELLKNSLRSCCGIGSKILVTTTNENVATKLNTRENGIHHLGVLSNESCWLLLKGITLLGRDEEECAKYKDIGMKIVGKCKGLPLAAKTLGTMLSSKKDLEGWEKVLNSEIWELKETQVGIFHHLLWSYNELSPALKRCFSYCAVFPKDSEIKVKEVIQHWMALGYLGSDIGSGGGRDMKIIGGQDFFEKLAMRSLFQDFTKDDWDEQIVSFKLHDIVHDFAQFLRKNGTAVVEAGTNKKTNCHVCSPYELLVSQVKQYRTLLLCYDNNKDPPPICGCFGSLRVLSLRRNSRIPHGIEKLIHLRWLDLSWVSPLLEGLETICNELYNLQTVLLQGCRLEEIPKGIGNLINLRHLDLSWNEDLKELPEDICEMLQLETLNINNCNMLSKLPQEIHRLVNLKHLHNYNTPSLRQFPQGIAQLTCLCTLTEFRVGKDMGKLGWLKNLNRLGGTLSLRISLTMDVEDARDGELRNKKHLKGLEILFDDEMDIGGVEDCVWVEFIDALQPHPNLQSLTIDYFKGSRLPSWIASPPNQVKKICLNNFSRLSSILLPPGKLPCLEEMRISRMPVMSEFLHGITTQTETGHVNKNNNVVYFPNLKKLRFEDCPNWEEWEDITAQEEEEDEKVVSFMPRLTELKITKCSSLPTLPHRLLSLEMKKLDISGSTQLEQRYGDKEGSPWKSISHIN